MTAEVVVYNKNAVALAADSAVTVYGSKTYNSANKLFMLSKYHPVGILIYNSASINNISSEIIVKEYRKRLGKKCFSTIKEYKEDFCSFLQKFLLEQITDIDKKNSIIVQLDNLFERLFNSQNCPKIQSGKEFFIEINTYLDEQLLEIKKTYNKTEGIDYSIIDLKTEVENLFKYKINYENINKNTIEKFIEIFKYYMSISNNPSRTCIAICGYGEKEFTPKVWVFETIGFINNFFFINELQNNEDGINGVIPLAQRDMTDLFVKGIDTDVYNYIVGQYNDFIDTVLSRLKNSDEVLLRYIKSNKSVVGTNIENVLYQTKIQPLLDVINILSKDELAELSESLVNLQALKHKMSLNLETVGGPIDVAIISKHDGFVWKKRKLYFDKDLNQHFFENYFSKDDDCDII